MEEEKSAQMMMDLKYRKRAGIVKCHHICSESIPFYYILTLMYFFIYITHGMTNIIDFLNHRNINFEFQLTHQFKKNFFSLSGICHRNRILDQYAKMYYQKKFFFCVHYIDISRILPIHSNTPIHLISDMKFDVFYVVSVITNVVSGTHICIQTES